MGSENKNEAGYTSKELLEMVQTLKEDMWTLRLELTATRQLVSKYNSLREKVDGTEMRLIAWENSHKGKHLAAQGIREWGGWIVAVLTFVWAVISSA